MGQAEGCQLPWVELDRLHHGPGWQAVAAEKLQQSVRALIDDTDGWVVNGSYDSKLGMLVLDPAELVVWLDLPLATKLKRLCLRWARNWQNDRELWNGNRESLKGWVWGSRYSSGPHAVIFETAGSCRPCWPGVERAAGVASEVASRLEAFRATV